MCRDRKGDRVVVGFAAESHDVVEAARRKVARKGCDLLVANDISRRMRASIRRHQRRLLRGAAGEVEELPLLSKDGDCGQLLDRVEKLLGSAIVRRCRTGGNE